MIGLQAIYSDLKKKNILYFIYRIRTNFTKYSYRRQEAIKQAERARHTKYKKQEEEREVIRQGIRDKVSC